MKSRLYQAIKPTICAGFEVQEAPWGRFVSRVAPILKRYIRKGYSERLALWALKQEGFEVRRVMDTKKRRKK